MRIVPVTTLVVGGVVAVAVGCGTGATQEERYAHLRDVAEKGADAHFVLVKANKETTREVCEQHYRLFTDGVPGGTGDFSTEQWRQLSLEYFTDSCVKGEPRVVRTRPATPSSPSPASAPAGAAANGVVPTAGN